MSICICHHLSIYTLCLPLSHAHTYIHMHTYSHIICTSATCIYVYQSIYLSIYLSMYSTFLSTVAYVESRHGPQMGDPDQPTF